MDEIRFNQQQEFTVWSVKLFEGITAHMEKSRAIVAHNKHLGFQDFDFNLVHAPFKLIFTNNHLPLEPRSYPVTLCILSRQICIYSLRHYREDVLSTIVVSNELVNEDPTNLIYSLEVKLNAGFPVAFQAGDTFAVIPHNTVSYWILITTLLYYPLTFGKAENVTRLIARMGYNPTQMFLVESTDINGVELSCSLGHNKCTLQIALSYFIGRNLAGWTRL